MALFTVYLPDGRRDAEGLERAAVFREGFSWLAFLFSGFWLLWHRLWLGLAAFIVLGAAIGFIVRTLGLGDTVMTALEFLLALGLGFEGSTLRKMKLERQGYQLAGVAAARNLEQAERKAFAALATAGQAASPSSGPASSSLAPPSYATRQPEVIGLFPHPEARR